MTEQLPESNEDLAKSAVEVTLTEDEFNLLADSDPKDSTVQELLTTYGMNLNENVVVHVEGRPDAVYTTSEDDFMTRDRAASQEWNTSVNVAQGILDLENEIDEQSLAIETEAIELGSESISYEEAQKIGEPPVENSGIENPSTSAAKRTFDRIATDIRTDTAVEFRASVNGLSENEQSFKVAEKSFLDGLAQSTARIESVLRQQDNYPLASLQTEIKQTIELLHDSLRMGMQVGEHTIGDIMKYTLSVEKKLTEQSQAAAKADEDFGDIVGKENAAGLPSVSISIETAKVSIGEIDTLKQSMSEVDARTQNVLSALESHVNHLDDILTSSYRMAINTDELKATISRINLLSADKDTRDAYKKANISFSTFLTQLKVASAQLDPAHS